MQPTLRMCEHYLSCYNGGPTFRVRRPKGRDARLFLIPSTIGKTHDFNYP